MAETPELARRFHVLMLFPTTPAQQREHAEKLGTFIREGIKVQPGFLSARLFLTEDGEKIVEHFQWMDRAAYEAYRARATWARPRRRFSSPSTPRSSSSASWRSSSSDQRANIFSRTDQPSPFSSSRVRAETAPGSHSSSERAPSSFRVRSPSSRAPFASFSVHGR